jgi:hypothetical protein
MAEAAQRAGGPSGRVALVFAVLALLASWNPAAAPFGLLVGVASAILALRARRTGRRRAYVAFGIAVLSAVASAVVLAITAGAVSIELSGVPIVRGRTPAELDLELSAAGASTRDERARALGELDRLGGTDGGPGGGGAGGGGAGGGGARDTAPSPGRDGPDGG